jgi:hypothetical protein
MKTNNEILLEVLSETTVKSVVEINIKNNSPVITPSEALSAMQKAREEERKRYPLHISLYRKAKSMEYVEFAKWLNKRFKEETK